MTVSRYRPNLVASEVFPPGAPTSALLAALLVRIDELKSLTLQVRGAKAAPSGALDAFLCMRMAILATADARELLMLLIWNHNTIEHIRKSALIVEGLSQALQELDATRTLWKRARDWTAAHMDVKRLKKSLRRHGDELRGGLWLSNDPEKCRFDLAHVIVASVYAGKGPTEFSDDGDAAQIIDGAARARDALLRAIPALVELHKAVSGVSLVG